jgi:hypothetical protein
MSWFQGTQRVRPEPLIPTLSGAWSRVAFVSRGTCIYPHRKRSIILATWEREYGALRFVSKWLISKHISQTKCSYLKMSFCLHQCTSTSDDPSSCIASDSHPSICFKVASTMSRNVSIFFVCASTLCAAEGWRWRTWESDWSATYREIRCLYNLCFSAVDGLFEVERRPLKGDGLGLLWEEDWVELGQERRVFSKVLIMMKTSNDMQRYTSWLSHQ